jgi:hypothetical protein
MTVDIGVAYADEAARESAALRRDDPADRSSRALVVSIAILPTMRAPAARGAGWRGFHIRALVGLSRKIHPRRFSSGVNTATSCESVAAGSAGSRMTG